MWNKEVRESESFKEKEIIYTPQFGDMGNSTVKCVNKNILLK